MPMPQEYYLGRALVCAIVDGAIQLVDGQVTTAKDSRIRNICSDGTTANIIRELEADLIRRTESIKDGVDSVTSCILEEYVRLVNHNQSKWHVRNEGYRHILSLEELEAWLVYCIDVKGAKVKGLSAIAPGLRKIFDWELVRFFHSRGEKIIANQVLHATCYLSGGDEDHHWFCEQYCQQDFTPDEIKDLFWALLQWGGWSIKHRNLYSALFKYQFSMITTASDGPSFVEQAVSQKPNLWRLLVLECGAQRH